MMSAVFPISLLFAAQSLVAAPASPIDGYWQNPAGTAIIVIAPCRDARCGKVIWASARGQREVARNAPNVVGTMVLTGLRPANRRWTGSLYIPDDDMHVSASLEPVGRARMKLTGCGFLGLICRTQLWTRVDRLPPAGR